MPFDQGFNFRGSSGYVTDGAGQTYVLGTDTYPTTRSSVTFGWDTVISSADRSTGVDVRLAGINYDGDVTRTFRVDLPNTGNFKLELAIFGDVSGGGSGSHIVTVYDNVTSKATYSHAVTAGPDWYDASDTLRTTAAGWAANQAQSASLSFASTTFKLTFAPNPTGYWLVSHLRIIEQVGGGGSTPRSASRMLSGMGR